MKQIKLGEKGFTIIELLVAMAISLVVMAGVYQTFVSQQDSYIVQSQVSAAQQNGRGAMFMMSQDIQMAGYYTNFDTGTYSMDWDDIATTGDGDGKETIRPLIYGQDNLSGVGGIKDGTDLLVIVKASTDDGRQLTGAETATGTQVSGSLRDVDDLKAGKCAVLAKKELSRAEFFEVQEDSGDMTLPITLSEDYGADDWIFRADVIVYYVDDDPDHPCLRRKNLGSNQDGQVVAEDIDNLQLQYELNGGSTVDGLTAGQVSDVRAVKIFLCARTARLNKGYTDNDTYTGGNFGNYAGGAPGDGYRRRVLSSVVKTRNIGL